MLEERERDCGQKRQVQKEEYTRAFKGRISSIELLNLYHNWQFALKLVFI